MRRVVLAVTLLGVLGCASLPQAERAATDFGERSFVRAGAGAPTVVFEAGLGDGKDSWARLLGELRDTTRVFAYDRAGYGGAADEYRAAPTTMQQLQGAGPFPNVPLVVLTGMRKIVEGPSFAKTWLDTQRELARSSPQARHEVCESCGHYVHRDRPELVARAIRDVVLAARGRTASR